jgi:hypothetical protein
MGVLVWKFRFRRKDERGNDDYCDDMDMDDDEQSSLSKRRTIELPQHLERELMKEERRQQMLPLLTMNRPMYDNILMKDPNGQLLCTISIKKANWYVRKNLAIWKDDHDNDDNKCIQLLFHPNRPENQGQQGQEPPVPNNLNTYNQTVKENRCVVCGHNQDYMRHYVVPYCYRSLFPQHFKTHLPHDIVLVCASNNNCHVRAGRKYCKRMNRLHDELRQSQGLDPETAQPEIIDKRVHQVRSSATAMLKWRDKLPRDKISEYESLLCEFYGLSQSQQQDVPNDANDDDDDVPLLTTAQLQAASELESRSPNPKYISGPTLVMESLKNNNSNGTWNDEAIATFVREWRSFFFETMQPQFLPTGWSVESPVQCDSRKSTSTVVS